MVIPLKKWANTRCFAFQLGYRPSFINTNHGEWSSIPHRNARLPLAWRMNAKNVSRVVNVPSKSKAYTFSFCIF